MFKKYLMNLVKFYRLKQLHSEAHEPREEKMKNQIMMYMCIYQIMLTKVFEEVYWKNIAAIWK